MKVFSNNAALIREITTYCVILCVIIFGMKYKTNRDNQLQEIAKVEAETKMNSICPSLFSVTRSARDTLIVMKAEKVCSDFILNNLK